MWRDHRPYLLLGDLGQPYAWKRPSHPMTRQEEPSGDFSQGHASLWSSFLLACSCPPPLPICCSGSEFPRPRLAASPHLSVFCSLSPFWAWAVAQHLAPGSLCTRWGFHSLSLPFSGRLLQICPDLCPQSMAGSEDTALLDFSPTPQLRVCVCGRVNSGGVVVHATGGLRAVLPAAAVLYFLLL